MFHDAHLLEHSLPQLVSNNYPHMCPGYHRFHAGSPAILFPLSNLLCAACETPEFPCIPVQNAFSAKEEHMPTSQDNSTTDECQLNTFGRPKSLWRNRDYMLLWSGQALSDIGGTVSELAFPLLVLAVTRSPAQAGFAAALRALPAMFFSLLAGVMVDRWNRKWVMLI